MESGIIEYCNEDTKADGKRQTQHDYVSNSL